MCSQKSCDALAARLAVSTFRYDSWLEPKTALRLRICEIAQTRVRYGYRGVPKFLFCDNGCELTSQIMDLWAYHNQVRIDFSRPGKPTDNAHVESFNGTLRAECLEVHWFGDLDGGQASHRGLEAGKQ
jgi:transposase InsO family protein